MQLLGGMFGSRVVTNTAAEETSPASLSVLPSSLYRRCAGGNTKTSSSSGTSSSDRSSVYMDDILSKGRN